MNAQSDTDHYFLDRAGQRQLLELLRRIPELAVELEITLCRQDRLGEPAGRRNRTEQPLPYNLAASEAADGLRAELAGAVRLVCEQRRIEIPCADSTPALANWLRRNIIALAMTEGADEVATGIRDAVDHAWWPIVPPERPVVIDRSKVACARRWHLNYSGIVSVAPELGEEYRNLTAVRLDTLIRAGKVAPEPGPWRPDWPPMYRLQSVLEAHLSHPIRRRGA